MPLPYLGIFLVLLTVYLAFSVWLRLDSRYPILMALLLLVVAAVEDGLGRAALANSTAAYVFLLLAGGIVLLVVDHLREERPGDRTERPSAGDLGPPPAPREAADER